MDNYESIRPRQNAKLPGPSESISAFGNVTIKLVLSLTAMDKISWDDVIINQDISWGSADIGIVYDKLISEQLESGNGSVTVNYAVLQNAAAAKFTVNLKGGEATAKVHGHASACYGNWVDPGATCLFEKTSDNYVEVNRGQNIPLLRSVAAVPLNYALKVTACLYDYC